MTNLRYAIQISWSLPLLVMGCNRSPQESAAPSAPSSNGVIASSKEVIEKATPSENAVHGSSSKTGAATSASKTSESNVIETLNLDTLCQDIRSARASHDVIKAEMSMQAFAKTWKPEGKLVTDLERLLGEPSEKTTEKASYNFDNGRFGSIWNFKLDGAYIVAVDRRILD